MQSHTAENAWADKQMYSFSVASNWEAKWWAEGCLASTELGELTGYALAESPAIGPEYRNFC